MTPYQILIHRAKLAESISEQQRHFAVKSCKDTAEYLQSSEAALREAQDFREAAQTLLNSSAEAR